jgi:mannose-6-phosphate isomerase-like protein (cupin superfamily)
MTLTGPFTTPFVARPPADRVSPWAVIAGSGRTGGQVIFGDALLPPHTPGPPRHVHKHEDEAVFVLEGMFTVEVGDQRFEAEAGTLVWLPRQHPHAFGNLSDEPCRVFAICVPGTLDGMFREETELFASLAGPPDAHTIALLEQIAARYDVTLLGPPLTS